MATVLNNSGLLIEYLQNTEFRMAQREMEDNLEGQVGIEW